ncbi:MAG: bifunctional diaminohydroxyphosphoribosylaminopyrimidine deaminase/5-amino-6-(5-phosphoribosylamino)uracil reductase RibD [Chitinophagaceae bacterium]|nr:MAG: bifunctional diaminohydroxyphosphoribosylaminopyrimidine deaminase/5-amino-6-(5-phosphoribosylamino)uracil reductase RibD [Chitinophagaceae bacterium]
MHRCLQLAALAGGDVAPNPVVGSVLVHNSRIIGEGYHMQYGKAHAEVNCLSSVKEEDSPLIPEATLYVSLEPCAHFGKTPPCADLIIGKGIKKVVVGCRDPFAQVDGKGIEKLKRAGVEVEVGVLEEECRRINKRFFLYHTGHRPYVTLKWAQTADGKIAGENSERLRISNAYTNRIVHKWRSEEAAIVVGTNTALADDPELSTRHWPGKNPVRIVVDMNLRLPTSLKLFSGEIPTVVFNSHRHTLPFEKSSVAELQALGVGYYQVTEDVSLVDQMLNGLYRLGIQSILVEGGTQLLQSFIDAGVWDRARVICNESLKIGSGLPAPVLKRASLQEKETVFSDVIRSYIPLPASF